ncbi:MAG: hypothetical protein V4494_06475 [Chlamydiota bacterium]
MSIRNIQSEKIGSPESIRALNAAFSGKNMSLHDASTVEEAEKLLQQGCTINARNGEGETPLAVQMKRFLSRAHDENLKKIVIFFVENDPNFKNDAANKRLFDGIITVSIHSKDQSELFKNYLRVACVFIEHGIDINEVDKYFLRHMLLSAANYLYDEEQFKMMQIFIKNIKNITIFDEKNLLFYKIIDQMIKHHEESWNFRYYILARQLQDRKAVLVNSEDRMNNEIFNHAITNLKFRSFSWEKMCANLDILNYLIDLGGGAIRCHENELVDTGNKEYFISLKEKRVDISSRVEIHKDLANTIKKDSSYLLMRSSGKISAYFQREGKFELLSILIKRRDVFIESQHDNKSVWKMELNTRISN